MQRIIISLLLLMIICKTIAQQNVGIGTTSPRFPLSFDAVSGQKISFWDDGSASGNNYGIGIQSGLLQFNTFSQSDAIVLGYGKSTAFTENFRFKGNGSMGAGVSNPVFPLEVSGGLKIETEGAAYTSGYYMNNSANTSLAAFIGMRDENRMGFYSPYVGWGLLFYPYGPGISIGYDNAASFIPMGFPPSLGKKISLYPGTTGDVGFGVAGNRLQIFSDNPAADVAIGLSTQNSFSERFSIKPTGALAVSGNTGSSGQYLVSNGPSAAPTWVDANRYIAERISTTNRINIGNTNTTTTWIPGLTRQYNIGQPEKVMVDYQVEVETPSCFACGATVFEIIVDDTDPNTGSPLMKFRDQLDNNQRKFQQGKILLDAPAGLNNISIYFKRLSGPGILVGSPDQATRPSFMTFEIVD